jgi:hypothetical protein
VRQRRDELGRVRKACRTAHLGLAGAGAADPDVVGDAPVEHRRVLGHVGDRPAQVCLPDAIDRLAADLDRAALDIREAQQQPCQRRLAAA